MRIWIICLIVILGLFPLSACQSTDTQLISVSSGDSVATAPSKAVTSDDAGSQYQLLYSKYIEGIDKTGIPLTNWQDPSEIRPDDFVTFFAAKTGFSRVSTDYGLKIPANVYEPYVQLYFDVSVEKLRKTRHYLPIDDTYSINILDGSPRPEIIELTESGDTTTLTLQYYSFTKDVATPSGQSQITIMNLSDNDFQYIACKTNGFQSESNPISDDDMKSNMKYAATYLDTAVLSGITSYTWEDATQIPPDCFISFFMAQTKNQDITERQIAAVELEQLVQQYFDVETEDIRKSSLYRSETQTYAMAELKTELARVVSASEYQNSITLYFEYYSATDDATVIRDGILFLETTDDGGYRYQSCETTDLTP